MHAKKGISKRKPKITTSKNVTGNDICECILSLQTKLHNVHIVSLVSSAQDRLEYVLTQWQKEYSHIDYSKVKRAIDTMN